MSRRSANQQYPDGGAFAAFEQARRRMAKRLAHLGNGAKGAEVIEPLKRYLQGLTNEIKRILSHHSSYYWLRVHRDLARWEMYLEPSDEPGNFKFRHRRFTLAILRFANADLSEVERDPQTNGNITGHFRIPGILANEDDWQDLKLLHRLICEYQQAVYRLKRAGKGGTFLWQYRDKGEFDVVLAGKLRDLVEIYDRRAEYSSNSLGLYGSWAQLPATYECPVIPDRFHQDGYRSVPPWGDTGMLVLPAPTDGLPIFDAFPNLALKGRGLVSPPPDTPPAWLLQWPRLEPLFPKLRLQRGYMHSKRNYEPDDLLCCLAALARWEREGCEKRPELWHQILTRGYSILSPDPIGIVRREIFVYFHQLKKEFFGTTSEKDELDSLLAVFKDLTWSTARLQQIDLLQASPTYFILPLDEHTWWLDWSLILDTLIYIIGPFGRSIGELSKMRGLQFQCALGAHLRSLAAEREFTVWWNEREDPRDSPKSLQYPRGKPLRPDLVLVVNRHLLLIEAKAHAARRELLLIGDPEKLDERWQKFVEEFGELDKLAARLAREPVGKDWEIPSQVKWIVPVLCVPLAEYVPSADKRWWLYNEIPRVCTPDELLFVVDRLRRGEAIFNQIRIARP